MKKIIVIACFLAMFGYPARAQDTPDDVRIISVSQSSSFVPTEEIHLYKHQGVTIAYYDIGGTIESAWLDNKSKVLLSTDGCLDPRSSKPTSTTSNSCKGKASAIHLLRPESSPFANRSNRSSLTVVVLNQGKRQTYRYSIRVHDSIAPTGAVTLISYVPQAQADASTPRIVEAVPPPAILGARLRSASARAQREGRLKDVLLIARTDDFIRLVEQGVPLAEAAQRAGVSYQYVNSLYKLY